ncbi:hypothetical protein B0I35DRAFT_116819 [Stachybotrys elegans]|uniref:DUF7708 domain-containing protein n=1 Tax=Stachybotrys elegans TaxID=80388 RepID=A0A8K0SX72_9HYPO|nr:hypothetical protein B0I35DRAFT_116819 [Stachybotrys elegans]
MDVFVQHHPEYVSLVWGSMKFLFSAVINHEEKIHALAKACSRIAEVLPRTHLVLVLYPSDDMKIAVAQLYRLIMVFVQAAVCWYKQGRLAHAWSAIAKPWALSFQSHVKDIDEQARLIDELSSVALKAEVRHAHNEITEARKELKEARGEILKLGDLVRSEADRTFQIAISVQSMQQTISVDVKNSLDRIREVQLGQILSDPMFQKFPTSGQSLEYCKSMRDRRRASTALTVATRDKLRSWSMQRASTFLITEAQSTRVAKDFNLNILGVIRESAAPALWALRYANYWEAKLDKIDLLRMLVTHALQINESVMKRTDYPITTAHLRDASTHEDWVQLFQRAISGMAQVFIVLDTDLLGHATSRSRYEATRWLVDLLSAVKSTAVKVVVSNTAIDQNYMCEHWAKDACTKVTIPRLGVRSHRSRRGRRIRAGPTC